MKNQHLKSYAAVHFGLLLFVVPSVQAYPPAPPHAIYGMVRGEDGEPVSDSSSIVFETAEAFQIVGTVAENLEPGVNYEVMVPMDANTIINEPYLENALTPLVPFRIFVVIGSTTNLPLQMQGDYHLLGEEGQKTRIDLTLGVDSDGDGLPDAWEQFIIDILGGGLTLADITPGGDSDGDGMTNYDEYIAGTYAFDEQELFELVLKERKDEVMVFQFLGISGRTYTIEGSSNLEDWEPVEFVVPSISTSPWIAYPVSSIGTVEVEVSATNAATFFRGIVQ